MSMRFPYQPVLLQGPPPPTLPPHATARHRPLVPVRVTDPATGKSSNVNAALLDSGADDSIFPLPLAHLLGVALLPEVPTGHAIRWGGSPHRIRFGRVGLELSDGIETASWEAVVAFSAAPIRYPILGQCGCLHFFNADFRGADQEVVLEANSSFPGVTR